MAEANSTTATPTKAADPKTAPKPDAPDDTMSKGDRDKLADGDPRKYDLADGEDKLVLSGPALPGADKGDKKADDKKAEEQRKERLAAGVADPPRPEPGTDVYLSAAGYSVVPAGKTPADMAAVQAGPHHPAE